MTVQDWMRAAATRLALAGIEASRLEAQLLAAHAQGSDRAAVLAHPTAIIAPTADALLERRSSGEPLAYILGYREFYGRRFGVNQSVLIPRQETETVVEAALQVALPGARVLDVGTGSGCIAITLKLERPDLQVAAVDISEAAIETARVNALERDADVQFAVSDLFGDVNGMFDVIVSNPPYIADDAFLPKEIREQEPAAALFAGPDGMHVYGRLADSARPPLTPGGSLVIELGDGMAIAVQAIFEVSGWEVVGIHPDLGGMPRAMVLRRRSG